jgi:hypothetical protein
MLEAKTCERVSRRKGAGLVLAAGIVLSLPLLLWGYPEPTHDGHIHAQWLECFARQLSGGTAYPRWLPEPNHGFGSAAFFFYPPLPLYVTSLFWAAAPVDGRAGMALGWAAALALMLSGVTALQCFRRFTTLDSAATTGAILYMCGPYHLAIDLLDRGANSEFWAFVWLPLIITLLHGVEKAAGPGGQARAGSPAILGFSIGRCLLLALVLAGLLFTHPLTAVAFFPVAVVFSIARGWNTFACAAVAAAVALCIGACYLAPLVAHQGFTQGAEMGWVKGDNIGRTMFFPTLHWSEPLMRDDPFNRRLLYTFYCFCFTWAAVNVAIMLFPSGKGAIRLWLWTMILAFCLFMMVPLSLAVYEIIPTLRRIQFAWRFMVCATFAGSLLVSLLMDAFGSQPRGERYCGSLWWGRGVALAIPGATLGLALVLGAEKHVESFSGSNGLLRTAPSNVNVYAPDAFGEYVPIGADSRAALAMFPNHFGSRQNCVIARGAGSAGVMFRSARRWLVQIDAETHCSVVLPQFWFPGWTVTSSNTGEMVRVLRRNDSGLLELESPPGEHFVDLRLEPLLAERLGTWLSVFGAGIAGLGLALVLRRRASERARHSSTARKAAAHRKAVHQPGTAAEPQGSSCTPHPGQGG